MAKKPLYVREYKDRHGLVRLEYRRKGHKGWSLRQPLRSTVFWEDYNAATNGEVPPGVMLRDAYRPAIVSAAKPQTMRWLIQEYKKSAAFTKLDPTTKRRRANELDSFCIEHGDKPYAKLERRHLLKLRDDKADTPSAANDLIKMLRQVFKYAIEYELVSTDPTRDIPRLASINPDGYHAWTIEEVEQYENFHPVGTKARLALSIMLYGGCARSSDVVRLGRPHLTKSGRLQYTQFKGRNKRPIQIDIPVIPEFEHILDASPTGDLTFLVTEFNRPFSKAKGFYNWFKKRCREAGLPGCSPHGVRKAAAARL